MLYQLCCSNCVVAIVLQQLLQQLFQNGVVAILTAWVVEIETCYRNKNMLQELHCS